MIDAALLLPKILARAGDSRELNEAAAKIAWLRAAGDGLCEHAVPVRLDDTKLIVAVADAVWQKQLQPMSSELIFRINRLLRRETVKSIEFRINPAALGTRAAVQENNAGKSPQPLPDNVISSAAGIEDAELRNRFMRAAANCIDRREAKRDRIT